MAYRFLLEVPEHLAAEANVAVAEAGDAQVVVVRNSSGMDFDVPYADLTVAAHSLRVIQSLYDWFDAIGASSPDIRIVMHSGDRVSLESVERSAMVAAIRRDQPWVERTIPMIGEHEEESVSVAAPGARAALVADVAAVETSPLERSWSTIPPIASVGAERAVEMRALNHVSLLVADVGRAERFYHDFLSMDIVGRGRRDRHGALEALGSDYAWESAALAGAEADVTVMRNGPVVLVLNRLGRGARLERGLLDHLSIRVDASTYTKLKGQVLMRSMEVRAESDTTFTFRDPFFVTWEITLQSIPDFIG